MGAEPGIPLASNRESSAGHRHDNLHNLTSREHAREPLLLPGDEFVELYHGEGLQPHRRDQDHTYVAIAPRPCRKAWPDWLCVCTTVVLAVCPDSARDFYRVLLCCSWHPSPGRALAAVRGIQMNSRDSLKQGCTSLSRTWKPREPSPQAEELRGMRARLSERCWARRREHPRCLTSTTRAS